MDPYSVKIKCGNCNKHKSKELYSATAVSKYQESQRKRSRNPKAPLKPIFCLACNHSNRDELTCSHCDRTMALDKFNKAQRKKGDDALCLDCSQEKQDREAEHTKEVQEIVIIEELKKSEIGGYDLVSSKLGTSELSRSRDVSDRYETDTNPSSQYYDGNDAVSLADTQYSAISSSNTRPTTGTAWDEYPGTKHRISKASGNSFVRQGAVPKDPYVKARIQHERQQRRQNEQDEVVREDSDESDDDGEDPY